MTASYRFERIYGCSFYTLIGLPALRFKHLYLAITTLPFQMIFQWAIQLLLLDATKKQFALAKKYGRDDKAANSHNYANGVIVAQVTSEAILRTKNAGKKINKINLYEIIKQNE
jgi:hypothetical protein